MKRSISEPEIDTSYISPENFVQVMLLLRNLQVAGALSINALSVVNRILREKKAFQLSASFWRQQFEKDLCPLIAVDLFEEEQHIAKKNMDTDEFSAFQKKYPLSSYKDDLMVLWDQSSGLPNQFYMFVAHLIAYVATTMQTRPVFKKGSFAMSLRLSYATHLTPLYPIVQSISLEQNGKHIDYKDWPEEIKQFISRYKLFSPPIMFAALEEDEGARSFLIIYELLMLGWRVSKDVKQNIPDQILGCITCGMIGNNLRVCGNCQVAQYCGKECQKKDWKNHSKNCN